MWVLAPFVMGTCSVHSQNLRQGKRCPVGAGHDGVIRVGHFVHTEKSR